MKKYLCKSDRAGRDTKICPKATILCWHFNKISSANCISDYLLQLLSANCEPSDLNTHTPCLVFILPLDSFLLAWKAESDFQIWMSQCLDKDFKDWALFLFSPRVHLQSGWAPRWKGVPDRAKTIFLSRGAAQLFHMLCIHSGWQCIIWEWLIWNHPPPQNPGTTAVLCVDI